MIRYLENEERNPEAFVGQVLVMLAAWMADQELASIKGGTSEGLERAPPAGGDAEDSRKTGPGQLTAMRRVATSFQCSASTALRVLARLGVSGSLDPRGTPLTF